MAAIDLDALLSEISPDAPCGENLEEDADFLLLEDENRFVEERQMGDSILPAEEPDWKVVRRLALDLLTRTKDVQVAMPLICALVRSDGFAGLEQGLALLNGWMENYWDEVYPVQDPEDDYPILRMNTLSALNDYALFRKPIQHIPLTQSALGNFSWQDIEVAEGRANPVEDEEVPKMSIIEGAFIETDFEGLQNLAASIKQALEQLNTLTSVLTEKAGAMNAPVFSDMASLLQHIAAFVEQQLQQRSEFQDDAGASEFDGMDTANTDSASRTGGAKVSRQEGVHSRADAMRAIDDICQYFELNEPSSPVPFLLQRAKKLMSMDFMAILRDMTPDGIDQAENICGIKEDDDDDDD